MKTLSKTLTFLAITALSSAAFANDVLSSKPEPQGTMTGSGAMTGGRAMNGEGSMMRQKMQHHFEEMDTDKDGAVSKSEFMAAAEKRFSKMDANNDGKITKDEHKAMRDQMREMHGGKMPGSEPMMEGPEGGNAPKDPNKRPLHDGMQ